MKSRVLKSLLRITVGLFIFFFLIYLFIARPVPVIEDLNKYENNVSAKNLEKHVYAMSETFAPRDLDHQENLTKVGLYIENEFLKSTQNVSIQKFEYSNDVYFNVIAKYGNLESDDIVIVGAHYDGYSDLPGADDNASGVAGILELSRLMPSLDLTNKQIHLVAYTLEEPPSFGTRFMGSAVHAESVKTEDIKLMISLEMIGFFSDEPDSQSYPIKGMNLIYPTTGNFISIVDEVKNNNAVTLKRTINKYTDLPAYSINAPKQLQGISFSDHRNYWGIDVPAVMITNTAYYRNYNYHTKYDTYEKLDYERMKKTVFGVFIYLKEY